MRKIKRPKWLYFELSWQSFAYWNFAWLHNQLPITNLTLPLWNRMNNLRNILWLKFQRKQAELRGYDFNVKEYTRTKGN